MKFARVACLGFLISILGIAPTYGQLGPTTGSVDGTVTDSTGAALPGVTVTATSPSEIGQPIVITNASGQYRFPALAPGTYSVKFELPGFRPMIRENVRTYINFTATIDARLEIASMTEAVTVVAEPPLVDSQNTTFQEIFKAEMLEQIPNSRDMWSIIAQAPGTRINNFDVGGTQAGQLGTDNYSSYGYIGGQGRTGAGNGVQNRIQMEGVNSTLSSGGGNFFDYGSFSEVQLGTASNDASMPVPGVLMNIALKSGGNQFMSRQTYELQNGHLQDRNVTDGQRQHGIGRGTRLTKYYDVNPDLGGPLIRSKLWFYTSVRDNTIERAVAGWPADAPGTGPDNLTHIQNGTYKLTDQLTPRDRLEHYFQLSRRVLPYNGLGSNAYLDAVSQSERPSWSGKLEWRRTQTSSFFFSGRFSTSGTNLFSRPYGLDGEVGTNVRHAMTDADTGHFAGSALLSRSESRRHQLDWSANLYTKRRFGASHSLRAGYLLEWETTRDQSPGYKDSLRLRFNSPADAGDFVTPSQVVIYSDPLAVENSLWHHGSFLQDQIRLGRGLTINPGIRWDYYTAYYPDEQMGGPFAPFFYAGEPLPNGYSFPQSFADSRIPGRHGILAYSAFGPRLGFAWSPGANSRHGVLKASWGRYYSTSATTISDNLNPGRRQSATFTWNDVNGDHDFQMNEFGPFVSNSGLGLLTIDPNIRTPYVDEMNAWYERRLFRQISGRIGFIRKKSNDEWQLINTTRTRDLWTVAREGSDPGPDGLVGTGDDRGVFPYWDLRPGTLPRSITQWQAPADNDSDFKSIDLTVDKRLSGRWFGQVTYHNTWVHALRVGHPEDPNEEVNNIDRSRIWTFKIFGTYQAPWGFLVSPNLRVQNGSPRARFVNVSTRLDSTTAFAVEPVGAYAEPHTTLWDLRVQRAFRLGGRNRLSVYVDVYNLFNSNTPIVLEELTGRRTVTFAGQRTEFQRFLNPTSILPPRVYRLGFRLDFGSLRSSTGGGSKTRGGDGQSDDRGADKPTQSKEKAESVKK